MGTQWNDKPPGPDPPPQFINNLVKTVFFQQSTYNKNKETETKTMALTLKAIQVTITSIGAHLEC